MPAAKARGPATLAYEPQQGPNSWEPIREAAQPLIRPVAAAGGRSVQVLIGNGDGTFRDETADFSASVSSSGVQANGHSVAPAISGNGRYVAFCSGSSNLVPGGPVHGWDLYVRDLVLRRTTRAGPGSCFERPAVSQDGRFIAYLTSAPEFEPGREAWAEPVVVDRASGRAQLAAPSPLRSHGHNVSISADGRFVAFAADAPQFEPVRPGGISDVFVFDSATRAISRISTYPGASLAFADSERPALSGDGSWIAFDSTAQLLPGAHEPHTDVVYARRLR